jgi:predicted AAA+ superfamily ATPase
VFENFVISEMYKNFMHRGEQPCIYFWRDTAGHEIDIVIDQGPDLIPVEIKSARTIDPDFFKNLVFWRKITGDENPPEALIYGGDISYKRSGVVIYPWFAL